MSGCLSVFRLQPQANLQAKQRNKIGKNGISTRIFSENISVNRRSCVLCVVCCVLCVVRVDTGCSV
jgi:aldehyde:ferredoxin oxidoreductase